LCPSFYLSYQSISSQQHFKSCNFCYQATIVIQATPVTQSTPVPQATPVMQATPITQATPVMQATPVTQATPVMLVTQATNQLGFWNCTSLPIYLKGIGLDRVLIHIKCLYFFVKQLS
jgi:hypothetical protein